MSQETQPHQTPHEEQSLDTLVTPTPPNQLNEHGVAYVSPKETQTEQDTLAPTETGISQEQLDWGSVDQSVVDFMMSVSSLKTLAQALKNNSVPEKFGEYLFPGYTKEQIIKLTKDTGSLLSDVISQKPGENKSFSIPTIFLGREAHSTPQHTKILPEALKLFQIKFIQKINTLNNDLDEGEKIDIINYQNIDEYTKGEIEEEKGFNESMLGTIEEELETEKDPSISTLNRYLLIITSIPLIEKKLQEFGVLERLEEIRDFTGKIRFLEDEGEEVRVSDGLAQELTNSIKSVVKNAITLYKNPTIIDKTLTMPNLQNIELPNIDTLVSSAETQETKEKLTNEELYNQILEKFNPDNTALPFVLALRKQMEGSIGASDTEKPNIFSARREKQEEFLEKLEKLEAIDRILTEQEKKTAELTGKTNLIGLFRGVRDDLIKNHNIINLTPGDLRTLGKQINQIQVAPTDNFIKIRKAYTTELSILEALREEEEEGLIDLDELLTPPKKEDSDRFYVQPLADTEPLSQEKEQALAAAREVYTKDKDLAKEHWEAIKENATFHRSINGFRLSAQDLSPLLSVVLDNAEEGPSPSLDDILVKIKEEEKEEAATKLNLEESEKFPETTEMEQEVARESAETEKKRGMLSMLVEKIRGKNKELEDKIQEKVPKRLFEKLRGRGSRVLVAGAMLVAVMATLVKNIDYSGEPTDRGAVSAPAEPGDRGVANRPIRGGAGKGEQQTEVRSTHSAAPEEAEGAETQEDSDTELKNLNRYLEEDREEAAELILEREEGGGPPGATERETRIKQTLQELQDAYFVNQTLKEEGDEAAEPYKIEGGDGLIRVLEGLGLDKDRDEELWNNIDVQTGYAETGGKIDVPGSVIHRFETGVKYRINNGVLEHNTLGKWEKAIPDHKVPEQAETEEGSETAASQETRTDVKKIVRDFDKLLTSLSRYNKAMSPLKSVIKGSEFQKSFETEDFTYDQEAGLYENDIDMLLSKLRSITPESLTTPEDEDNIKEAIQYMEDVLKFDELHNSLSQKDGKTKLLVLSEIQKLAAKQVIPQSPKKAAENIRNALETVSFEPEDQEKWNTYVEGLERIR